ncbi:Glycosyltransferase involved in cell wall bisynthesis [Selenomonas ruminantium]|uniref:Glycosyltransferase involved in cell wall bisynthesis n=1 Tax=Selenomonas ruminantium TaxID=971 RepID=A0A1I3FN60_SELRU|nr:glycosyltransferase [Selenomonas ruminantium]SFI12663.1 Glycosyltransferase involved in cell wall bisynthesis [Selenomonas ruminantium]
MIDKMNIVFLAPANNYHTLKWCKWFSERGHKVSVISLTPADDNIMADVYCLQTRADVSSRDIKKILYFTRVKKIESIIQAINPDIIAVHYASSYGAMAALSRIKKYFLFVWGSDIYSFPNKSFIHKALIKFILYRACFLCSTSKAMAIEASKYTSREFSIVPFGVDTNLFNGGLRYREDKEKFVIGTVKTLSPEYGIDYLLMSVAIIRKKYPYIPIEVRIAGRGSHETVYKKMALELGIRDCVSWLGFISQKDAAKEWANMDCAVIPSRSESFGVSAVEAQACECPVVISDLPGLMEATCPGKSSIVVKSGDVEALVKAIKYLYDFPLVRKRMGEEGRKYVIEKYDINKCFSDAEKMFYGWKNRND